MKLTDKFEIENYNDFKKHKKECFDIIEDFIDLCFEEMLDKNPTFLHENECPIKCCYATFYNMVKGKNYKNVI